MVGWSSGPRGSRDLIGAVVTPLRSWDGVWYAVASPSTATTRRSRTATRRPSSRCTRLIVAATEKVLPFSYALSGVLVSNLAFLPALLALYRLTRGALRRRRRPPHDHLSRDLAAVVRVLDDVHREPLAAADRRHVPAARAASQCGPPASSRRSRCWRAPSASSLPPAIAWQVFDDHGRGSRGGSPWRLVPVCCCRWPWSRSRPTSGGAPARPRDARRRGARLEPAAPSRCTRPVPLAVVHALWIAFCDNHDLGLAASAIAVCALWLMLALIRTGRRRSPAASSRSAAWCCRRYTGTWLGFPRFGLLSSRWSGCWPCGARRALRLRCHMRFPALMVGLRVRILRCGNLHAVIRDVELLRRHVDRRAAAARARAPAGHRRRLRRRRLAEPDPAAPAAPARRVLRAARRPRLRGRDRAGRRRGSSTPATCTTRPS